MESLMIRGVLEVRTDFTKHNVMIMVPRVMDFTVKDDRLWVQTVQSPMLSMSEYRAELLHGTSFVGYSTVFLLETEDAITQLKLTDLRVKHRCGLVKPDNLMHFSLCTILSCVENCNLSRQCLFDLLSYLRMMNVRDSFGKLLQHSARRLICSALYLFFEEKDADVVEHVPATFMLYLQARHSCLEIVTRFFFRITRQDEDHVFSLKLTDRKTLDGWAVGLALLDVLNANFPNLPGPPKISPSGVLTR
ncbi:tegument protein UL7 [Panine betaherpesvirus 2]|uniref:Tegument protein UL7 n=1 Tax=Panine betaherpesvirus 2 TaxID=188763 RepID=Q8QRZ8_9BETA|nr:tegument protein UL7 [Panine betaherpesvirus 2]AAM00740.1 tegument protein UL7 [Panine betaherpesvirus 2]QXV67851.1 tegument protein UL7 [Panine betaherpesvirus 2]